MKEPKQYWPVDGQTKEIKQAVLAEYRGGFFHIPQNALEVHPLPPKEGFAVIAILDDSGKAINSEYIEDHRNTRIYDESDCTKSEVVFELGPIKDGYTQTKPLTDFDEWINNTWVTNESNKYIYDYALNDAKREVLYRQLTDTLEIEYARKVRQGKTGDALILSERIDELESKIKADNPWPIPPQA
ncbi:hypothetical protein RJD40_20730 [Vibrio scophthalmi]|uniref:hypothetical protein n=1 Tax=Vibrio scophthalmi TaxID=45658 RepID=UPI003AAC154C